MANEGRDLKAFDDLITDRPEIKAFDEELEKGYVMGQWHAERILMEGKPQPLGVPYLWKWSYMENMLTKASTTMEKLTMARRSLLFTNPSFAPRGGTTIALRAGMQLIKHGEVAWAHQHTAAAIRFVVEGSALAYTAVNGEKIPMMDNDLILTPMWSWHNHESQAHSRVVWIDAVDTPIVRHLNAVFFREYPEPRYERAEPGASFVAPAESIRVKGATQELPHVGFPLVYRWRDTQPLLEGLANTPGDPHDGVTLEYRNPVTGGPTLPTMACGVQMLRSGEETRSHRHTWSTIYYVISGEGTTGAGEGKLQWGKRDVFVVPNWCWHSHRNEGKEPAILFALSDLPVYQAFGLDREEAKKD